MVKFADTPQSLKRKRELRRKQQETPAERAQIRAIRAAHLRGEYVDEPRDGGVEDMNRDDLVAELKAAGQFVPPKIKGDTLRRKVKELRDGEGSPETATA